jgi:hypothetical protein
MERSVIRDWYEASMPPRISLRSIAATLAEIRVSIDHGVVIGVRSNPKPDEIAVGFSC